MGANHGFFKGREGMLQVRDLGTLDGPVMLFGGPYSNLEATAAAFQWAEDNGIAPSHRICTGDMVAYCANPLETVAMLRAHDVPVVAGNCERQLAAGATDCGCGFEEGSVCETLSQGWYAYASKLLNPDDLAYFNSCPDRAVFEHGNRRYVVVHGGASAINKFLWPLSPEDEFWREISILQEEVGVVEGVISGHSGIPFRRNIDGVDWINTGAIGMPAHDGATKTWFAVLEDNKTRFVELSYDWKAAQKAMIEAGLTQGYETSLETGYWPSEEILPKALRQSTSARG